MAKPPFFVGTVNQLFLWLFPVVVVFQRLKLVYRGWAELIHGSFMALFVRKCSGLLAHSVGVPQGCIRDASACSHGPQVMVKSSCIHIGSCPFFGQKKKLWAGSPGSPPSASSYSSYSSCCDNRPNHWIQGTSDAGIFSDGWLRVSEIPKRRKIPWFG